MDTIKIMLELGLLLIVRLVEIWLPLLVVFMLCVAAVTLKTKNKSWIKKLIIKIGNI